MRRYCTKCGKEMASNDSFCTNCGERSLRYQNDKFNYTEVPAIFSMVLLLLSFFDWSYGYYIFLRIVVTLTLSYYFYYLFLKERQGFWFWTMALMIILFNPLIPVYIGDKSIWGIIDFATAIFLFVFIKKEKVC